MGALKLRLAATADAAGVAIITITPRGNVRWIVQQVSPEMESASSTLTGEIREGGFLVAPFVPQSDAVAGEPPVELLPGEEMTIEWRNAIPGDSGRAWIQIEQVDL